MSTTKPKSKAARILAANLELLIGEGKRYRSKKDLGELPRYAPLGEKMVQRLMGIGHEPGIDTIERISDATGIPLPLLLIPNMRVHTLTTEAGIRSEIASLIEELIEKDSVRPLTPEEIQFVAGALNLVKRGKLSDDAQGKPGVR